MTSDPLPPPPLFPLFCSDCARPWLHPKSSTLNRLLSFAAIEPDHGLTYPGQLNVSGQAGQSLQIPIPTNLPGSGTPGNIVITLNIEGGNGKPEVRLQIVADFGHYFPCDCFLLPNLSNSLFQLPQSFSLSNIADSCFQIVLICAFKSCRSQSCQSQRAGEKRQSTTSPPQQEGPHFLHSCTVSLTLFWALRSLSRPSWQV